MPFREGLNSFRVQSAQLKKRIQAEVSMNNLHGKERYILQLKLKWHIVSTPAIEGEITAVVFSYFCVQ
jgi:hypothetical protein